MASISASLYKYSTTSPQYALGFEDDDGLVGARHDGFGDRNQAFLLAEDTESRWLPFAGIEFRGCALRNADAAGLHMRQMHGAFCAVAHALFEKRWHNSAR